MLYCEFARYSCYLSYILLGMHFHADVPLSFLLTQSTHTRVGGLDSTSNKQNLFGRKIHHRSLTTQKVQSCTTFSSLQVYTLLQHVFTLAEKMSWTGAPVMCKNISTFNWIELFEVLILQTQPPLSLLLQQDSLSIHCVEIDSGLWCIIVVSANQITAVHERNPLGSPKETADFSFSTFLRARYPRRC